MSTADLRIDPKILGPIMGALVQHAHHWRYRLGFPEERQRSAVQSCLLGWVIKKIKYYGNDWSIEGPVGAANADWIAKCVDEAIAGAEAVQRDIDKQLEQQ